MWWFLMTAEIVRGFNPVQITCACSSSPRYLLYIGNGKCPLRVTEILICSVSFPVSTDTECVPFCILYKRRHSRNCTGWHWRPVFHKTQRWGSISIIKWDPWMIPVPRWRCWRQALAKVQVWLWLRSHEKGTLLYWFPPGKTKMQVLEQTQVTTKPKSLVHILNKKTLWVQFLLQDKVSHPQVLSVICGLSNRWRNSVNPSETGTFQMPTLDCLRYSWAALR